MNHRPAGDSLCGAPSSGPIGVTSPGPHSSPVPLFKELRLERGRLGLGYIRACQTPKSGLPAGVLLAPQSLRLGGTIEMTPDKPCTGSFQVSE